MTFDGDTTACAALTERSDPDRFAATMALPVSTRARLFPLWAFNIEVARAPWVTKEPLIAEMRLQWWRDALDEIGAGDVVRRHEVVTPLSTLISAEQAKALGTLVDARKQDIEAAPFDDEATLWRYLDATTGTLLWTAAEILGAPSPDEAPVRRVASAIALVNWLRAVPELEARGKHPLPDGRPETIANLARTAQASLADQHDLSRAARRVLLTGFPVRATLRQIIQRPADVAGNRLHLPPLARSAALIKARILGRI